MMVAGASTGILVYDHIPPPVVSTAEDILDGLVFSHTYSLSTFNTLKVFWDLDSSVRCILTLLPDPIRSTLARANRAAWKSYRLYYIPGKQFSVNKDHNEVDFYDLSQYFPDINGEPSPTKMQKLADELWQCLTDLGLSSTKTLASPVAIALSAGWLDEVKSLIPTVWDAPDHHLDAIDYAVRAGGREWVSNYQLGCWQELYSYDLSSAYPSIAVSLPDLRDCELVPSNQLNLSKMLGFVYGDLYIDPESEYAYCSPVLTRLPDGQLTNAVGHLPTDYYALDTVRHVCRYGMGEFRCKSAWYIHPRGGVRPRFPFRQVMTELFQRRTWSDLASYFLKRVMNGLIGKMLEVRSSGDGTVRYGELYNPVYHATILAGSACRVADFIIHNRIGVKELIHVGVDGVKSTKELTLPPVAPMGQWRKSGPDSAIILSSAGVYTPDRSPQGVSLPLFQAMLEAHPKAGKFSFGSWDIDLRALPARQNREYAKLPKTGGQLLGEKYLSEPVTF